MADVSEWSAVEAENTHLDNLTLSGESGQYINKVMCAVKAKETEQDAILSAVAARQEQVNVGFVLKGTAATSDDLPEDPSAGDTYIVSADGEYYAWNGTEWVDLGINDAGLVHKTGNESVGGTKTFSKAIVMDTSTSKIGINGKADGNGDYTQGVQLQAGSSVNHGANLRLYGKDNSTDAGQFELMASTGTSDTRCALEGSPGGTLSWNGQTIQTSSDARLKTSLETVPDSVLDAWEAVQWGQFQFLSAVERKGADARLHVGVIAQRVKAVFEDRGLDACQYGILCHEVRDARGEDEEAVDLWMVRYEEALAMEAACQRRRAARLEARIAALEMAAYGK